VDDKPAHLIERAAARLGAAKVSQDHPAPPLIAKTADGTADTPSLKGVPVRMPYPSGSARIDEPALKRAGLINWELIDNRVAEEFRVLQNELLRQGVRGEVISARRDNLIMVTSALQGEGKSFTALNLSAGIARHGQRRVLLVDADCKAGALAHLLDLPETPGLLDIVDGHGGDIAELTISTAIENLSFLPIGNSAPNRGAELLSGRRIGEIIQEIGRKYADSLVILDTPPCLLSSAPNTLAGVVHQTIVVVAANSTQEADVTATLELLSGCRQISLILNKIPPWTGHSFGTYYT
jgi:protein-tyrosine kinase